nr:hypothetical protein [Tanacetum cinerariifolium]
MVTTAPQDKWSQDKQTELVNIIGNLAAGMLTRAMAKELSAALAYECLFVDFLSKEEPKKVSEALKHLGWVDAIQEELNQFARNKVWTLVPARYGKTIIGSTWVFRNKRDETGIVIKNKVRLVAQGYNQQEGIDYDETFTPVVRLEAIKIFLAFTTYMNFIVYQMDVKSAFLNGKLNKKFMSNNLQVLRAVCFSTMSANWTKHSMDLNKLQEHVKTPMVPLNNLRPDLNGKVVNETHYRGAYQLLGGKLVCWSAKKQQSVAMSSAEAKYVAAAGCCANILWMKSQLTDYDIIYEKVRMTLEGKKTWLLRLGAGVYDSWKLKGDVEELWDELAKLGLVEEEDGGWICFLGGNNSSGTKKYQGLNSGEGGNTKDGVKITSRVIGFGGEIGKITVVILVRDKCPGRKGVTRKMWLDLWPRNGIKVEFTFEKIAFITNNEDELLYPSHLKKEYFKCVSDFISKCCLKEAFTRAPNQYKEYLSEFWYTTNVLPDFKIWVSTPAGEVRGEIGTMGRLGQKELSKRVVFLLDYAKIIWEDLIHKLNKKTREKIVPYSRFISLLLEHMAPKYDNEELTINPTKVFSIHNCTLKPYQPKEPPFTNHMKNICNLDVHVDSKAPKYSSPTKEKETKSSSAMDTSPSHPLPLKSVVGEMHKEAQQAAGGPTSLGDTTKDGAHPQLSNGTKNYSFAHMLGGSNPSVLVDKTKSARDWLKTKHTTSSGNKESRADDILQKVKLEDLADILKDTRSAFFTSTSLTSKPIIILNVSEEEENAENDKDIKDTSVSPPSLKSAKLQELMAQVYLLQSQKTELEQAKVKAKAEVALMKAKPSYLDNNHLLNFQLRIVLSVEDTFNYLEHPILAAPIPAHAGQQVALEALAAHVAWVKGSKEIEEGQSFSLYVLKIKSYIDNLEHLGHPVTLGLGVCLILILLRKEFDGFVQNYNMHNMGKTINELHAMLKLHEQTLRKNNTPALHAIRAGKGLRGSRKLKQDALILYVRNGQRVAVEAIGSYHLSLPNGLVIVLNNFHYAPSITRGIILVSCLYDDGYVNRFMDNSIQVSRNNMVYFSVVPRDGIFEINLSDSYRNHCHLKHIIKKLIEKLQYDRLLNSTDLWAFEKCVPCMSGKMARNPYTHQVERAKDLLGLIHTDVCGPFNIVSRQGASYFLTFINDFSRYGYVYLLKHKQEVFETFKVFQKEVENQLAKTIKSLRSDRGGEYMSQEFLDHLKDHGFIAHRTPPYTPQQNDTSLNHKEDDLEIDKPQSDIIPIRRSTKTPHAPDRMCFYINVEEHELGDLGEPANYKAVLLDPESNKWLNAMNVEIYTQTPRIDYEKTFSPVADIRAIRILIAIAAFYDYEIWQMDVKTAFLNGYISKEVYMEQPEGFVNPKYQNRKFGFTPNCDKSCVYLKANESNVTFLILYVDDILILGNNIPMLQDVKSYIGRCFAMKDLGEAPYILRIKICIDRSRGLIGLCQSAYIEKILKRYNMENSKRGSIPMQDKLRLSKSQGTSTPAELKRMQNVPYASVVGSIMYDTTIKNILKYLRNTKDMFLVSEDDTKRELRVSCYIDAGYLIDADDLKSQTGYVFVLNEGVVDWKSAKQSIFATSSVEAEYIATYDSSKEVVWVRKFIFGLDVVPTIEDPINMYYDNTGAITIANESGITKGARHFRAKVHYLHEVIEYGDVKLEKVHTDDNLIDPFTKVLAFPKHSEHTKNIRMLPASSLM